MPIVDILIDKKLRTLKKLKGKEQMIKDFKKVVEKYLEAVKALEEFEKKWGLPEELLQEIVSIEDLLGVRSFKSSLYEKLSGRFYFRLALEIEWLASKHRESVLSIPEIIVRLKTSMGLDIKKKDLMKAIKILEKRNLVRIVRIDTDEYVVFTHILDEQIKDIINLFSKFDFLTPADVVKELGWSLAKAIIALERLYELGLCTKEEFPLRYYPVKFK